MSHCCTECRSLSLEVKTGTAIHFESVLRTRLYRPTEYLCAAESSLHPNHLKPWGPCKHLALLLLRVRNVAPEQIWQIKGQKLIFTSFDLTTLNGTKKPKKGGSGFFCVSMYICVALPSVLLLWCSRQSMASKNKTPAHFPPSYQSCFEVCQFVLCLWLRAESH